MESVDEISKRQAEAIEQAGAMTEAEMHDAKAPSPKSLTELSDYINSLVERPHDYGTCVYAMSLAATATFNYVAGKLGVTGFQASCADLDILRRTRGLEMGCILDYEKLLYPQYCNDVEFPSWQGLLANQKLRPQLAELARNHLAESPNAHPNVIAHWKKLAANG